MYELRSYQQEAVDSAMNHMRKSTEHAVLELATGCHAVGHPILMADGSIKSVQDVVVGDKVMGIDSQPRTVVDLHRGVDDMYKITPTKGGSFIVNKDHIFNFYLTPARKTQSSKRYDMSLIDLMASNKTKKHRTKLWRDRVDSFGSEKDLIIDPYILGVLIGDGHFGEAPSFSGSDPEIIESMQSFAKEEGLSIHETKREGTSSTFYISDKNNFKNSLRTKLGQLGLDGSRSGDKFIPIQYKVSSRENRFAILSGLIDTDAYYDGGVFDYSTKSSQLADDVVFLSRSLGLAAYKSSSVKSCQTGASDVYHRVTISGDIDLIPTRVARKKAGKRIQIKRVNVTGFKYEFVGEGNYYGFELDGDRLYLDGNFIVHHNSGKSLVVADIAKQLYQISKGKRVLCLQPSAELTRQNFEKYSMTGEKASIYSASISKSLRHPVIYATPGTFKSVAKRLGSEFTAVIYDECHRTSATIRNIISDMKEGNPNLRVLGLTATPYRLGEGFIYEIDENDKIVTAVKNPYYKKLLFRVTEPELVELGFLTPPLVGSDTDSYDTSSLKMKGSKFTHESVMQTFEGHGRLTSKIVADVVARSYGRNGVMFFGASIEHCLEIMASLPPEQSRMVTGETPKEERRKIIDDFKNQKIRYLVSKDVLTTGFDAPHVDVIAILRATESHALFTQIRGRGARLFDNKQNYLLLDYGNNIDRLYPDGDIYNPTIDIPAPETESFPVTVHCPECNKENEFSMRPNQDDLEIDREGYFVDLDGNRVETDVGPIPAHYGRRCQNVNHKLERCDYYWTCKECEICHHKNDIAARRCEACKHEFIDPNEKLDLEFKRLKRSPSEWQTDEVLSWRCKERKSKNGNEMYVVDVQTEYRMVVFYVVKNSDKIWLQKQEQLFLDAIKNDATPRTITYKKQENGLWTVKDYNKPTDEEIYNARLEQNK